ncbi:FAD-binding oxidoreductase [Aureimonas psammosilenae]|uniref:FAD-binding oxidoreductase n=1 Tax=Aureimonas psammosilenae TaxID=2495496 RepID=UPI00126122C6|nr:FAD-linked oxidase C-terminal domain-containing protein [Aureimonas psammosilenae]
MLQPIANPPRTAELVARLRDLLGDRCSTSVSEREHHGRGESYHPVALPDAVVYPLSTAEVSAIAALCNEHRVALIAFGAGTSLEGHVSALSGGVSLDLRRMDTILAVHAEDLDATVQAGVTRKALNAHLRDTGLFFAIDPGADATLGGMAATRASGTAAVRYGTMRENVVALTVVLADGRVVKTASRARKSSAGYDLTRLFVGSEGTLGIITEVTVRLHGQPEAVSAAICTFPAISDAIQTAIEVVQSGIPVGRMEFLDPNAIAAVNAHSGLDLAVRPTLFFEFSGSPSAMTEQSEAARDLALGNGGEGWSFATSPEDRSRLWHARHEFHYAIQARRPGATVWATDACVPVSRMAECIEASLADAAGASFPHAAVGHVGDGNFHMSYLIRADDPAELAEAQALNARLIERTLAFGGTCTGEHGVGYGKSKYLVAEHGTEAVDVMRAIKAVLDPNGVLNPGKVLPGL